MEYLLEKTYLRELFESMSIGVLVADDSALYVDANAAACALFNRPRAEIVGHHLSEFIHGARREEVNIQWHAFLRDGFQAGKFTIQLPEGSPRTFEFQARARFAEGLHCSFVTATQEVADTPGILTMCAWTKRIQAGDKWLTIEQYLSRVHGVDVTHGISPDAFDVFGRGLKAG